jgi:hypothetical protein
MIIKFTIYGKQRDVTCADRDCPERSCWHPHDCPIQGAGGVRESAERWMCLTNALNGCPDIKPEPIKKAMGK